MLHYYALLCQFFVMAVCHCSSNCAVGISRSACGAEAASADR